MEEDEKNEEKFSWLVQKLIASWQQEIELMVLLESARIIMVNQGGDDFKIWLDEYHRVLLEEGRD